jgi:hypothetical protein
MHPDGFLILITPLLGLFTILRGGKWNWNVAKRLIGDDSPWGKTFNAFFWFTWFSVSIIGTLRLCGIPDWP